MKIYTSTARMRFIFPGLYGTRLGDYYENVSPEYENEFKDTIVAYGIEEINRILSEKLKYQATASNGKFVSPSYYNFENDEICFDLEIEDSIIGDVTNKRLLNNKSFFEWLKENYGSCSGFISFMPYHKEKWIEAIGDEKGIKSAIEMYIMWLIGDIEESYQEEFEENVIINCEYEVDI